MPNSSLPNSPETERAGRSTGPTSREGKAKASGNSTTHGCTAKKLIVADERQDDYDRLRDGWWEEFEPEGYQEERLVEILILNDWQLQRATRKLGEAEEAVFGSLETGPKEWDAERFHRVELMQRYKTTAERAFYRAWSALQGLRKDIMRNEEGMARLQLELEVIRARQRERQQRDGAEKQPEAKGVSRVAGKKKAAESATAQTQAQKLFQGQKAKKKQRKIQTLEQWAEITVEDGVVKTWLIPSNEALIEQGQTMDPPPEMVYRRLNFVQGVPAEYEWVGGTAEIRERGGCGIQRMSVDTWLEVIEREKALGTGHIGPCGGNLPRPEERGGCDCPVCVRNAAILAERVG